MADLPSPRGGLSGLILANQFYVVGGKIPGQGGTLDDVLVYNISTDNFTNAGGNKKRLEYIKNIA